MIYLPRTQKVDWLSDGRSFLLCALTGVAINQSLFFKGISLTSAVNGSIIMTLTPVLVLIWSSLILNERVTHLKMIGVFLGLVGAIITIYDPKGLSLQSDWRGDILILLNGASYGLYLVLVKPLMKKYRPLTVITWIFTIGLFLVFPLGFREARSLDLSEVPTYAIFAGFYTIIFVTVLVYLINAWTLTRVNPSVVGAFIYLQPIFATFVAIIYFEERFLWKHLLASIFVFGGVYLVTKRKNPQS